MSNSKVIIVDENNHLKMVPVKKTKQTGEGGEKKGNIWLRILSVAGVTLVVLLLTVYLICAVICKGPSNSAKQLFVTTMLETGALKWVASVYMTEDEIQAFVNQNTMKPIEEDVDVSLIQIGNKDSVSGSGSVIGESGSATDENAIEIINITGRTYSGTLMIVKDPSRISLETVYNKSDKSWPEYGKNLDVFVKEYGAIAGVNGGLYEQYGANKGGVPSGIVVSHGEIQMNLPQQHAGLYLIGLNNDNILIVKSLKGMSAKDFEAYVKEAGIRDACVFQEDNTDTNAHFVQLVINGEAREMNGLGSGLNPRTAIGQRADGAIMFLVTDGRGYNNHLGASASDLINVMLEYGAVNAANLDGGSSSCLYYNGEYLKTSVTFKYSHASWYLPVAFLVY